MRIEPVIGLQAKDKIISEREFEHYSIFRTQDQLEAYFQNYGYHFIGFYDEAKDLIVVKNNNKDLEILLANPNMYRVINYRTREVVIENLGVVEALEKSFPKGGCGLLATLKYRIDFREGIYHLVDAASHEALLEAEEMYFLNHRLLFYRNYGMEYLFDTENVQVYPLSNTDQRVYMGREEFFVDMRTGMYATSPKVVYTYPVDQSNLRELVRMYPYGEIRGNWFHLLNYPIRHGIFYENEDTSKTKWYSSHQERNDVLTSLGILVEEALKPPPKQKELH